MSSKTKKTSPAHQLVKFCRIFQWVEIQDPEFALAISELCLEGALSPSHGHGVTFLYPEDKAHREEIVTKTYSIDADEAIKMIHALIIPAALVSGTDFKRDVVGTRAGVRLTVESAEAGRVKLAGDVELAVAKDFLPLAKREGDIAVWIITSGRPPLTGESFAPPAPVRKPKKKGPADSTGGSRRVRGGAAVSQRSELAARVEAEYKRGMLQDGCRGGGNPYLAKVVSLLNYLRAKNTESYEAVLPLVDLDPFTSFYLLIEPYKTEGTHLIQGGVLFGEGAWNGGDIYSDAAAEFEAHFQSFAAQDISPHVENVRASVVGNNNPREAPALVHAAYQALTTQNTIDGQGPILPAATIAILGGGSAAAAKKLWQDELRFILGSAIRELRSHFIAADFDAIVGDLREKWPGNNYGAETFLTNIEAQKANVAPRSDLMLFVKFINSSDFLYFPCAPAAVGGTAGSLAPDDYELYDRNSVGLADLHRTTGMVRASGVSPSTLQELEIYVQTHGKLPDDIAGLAAPAQ